MQLAVQELSAIGELENPSLPELMTMKHPLLARYRRQLQTIAKKQMKHRSIFGNLVIDLEPFDHPMHPSKVLSRLSIAGSIHCPCMCL
jgi:hypothetical protein